MDGTAAALTLARGRIAFGALMLVAPKVTVRVMGGGRRPAGTAPLLARMVGGRDIALGLGTVIALDRAVATPRSASARSPGSARGDRHRAPGPGLDHMAQATVSG